MSTESSISANGGTSIATQIAIIEVESEQAVYESESAIRDAERAAKREHDKEQAQEIRDKASDLVLSGVVAGSLTIGSSVMQFEEADAMCDAGTAASSEAKRYSAASTALQGGAKTSELLFTSLATSDEADAAEEGNAAEDAQARADDANAARQRALSELDAKLAIAQELLRSDTETMSVLIRPA